MPNNTLMINALFKPLIDKDQSTSVVAVPDVTRPSDLNDSQYRVYQECHSDNPMVVVQGPPGTGKTKVMASVVLSLSANKTVMLCAESNKAVDNLLLAVIAHPGYHMHANTVRLVSGSDKTSPSLRSYIVTFQRDDIDEFKDKGAERLKTARLLACTNIMSAVSSIKHCFDVVIIDEATQSSWGSLLCPMSRAKSMVIMIGDQQQLSPMEHVPDVMPGYGWMYIHSPSALFLDTQHRMVPAIAEFASRTFYDNRLKTHTSCASRALTGCNPFSVIQVYGQEKFIAQSYCNELECKLAFDIMKKWRADYGNEMTIAFITGYNAQRSALDKIAKANKLSISIGTVDSFQGQEFDLVVYSVVRTKRLGFMQDFRRLNVALTRAKRAQVAIGNFGQFHDDVFIRKLTDYAHEIQCLSSSVKPVLLCGDSCTGKTFLIGEITKKKIGDKCVVIEEGARSFMQSKGWTTNDFFPGEGQPWSLQQTDKFLEFQRFVAKDRTESLIRTATKVGYNTSVILCDRFVDPLVYTRLHLGVERYCDLLTESYVRTLIYLARAHGVVISPPSRALIPKQNDGQRITGSFESKVAFTHMMMDVCRELGIRMTVLPEELDARQTFMLQHLNN